MTRRFLRVLACVVLLALLTLPRVHAVWDGEHGAVLAANDRDAVVAVSTSSYGWTGSPIGLVLVVLRAAAGGGNEFTHKRSRLRLFVVQRSGIRREVVDGPGGRVGFLDGAIVVAGAGVGLRWNGVTFASLGDAERTDAIERMVTQPDPRQGTVRRGLLTDPGTDVTFRVDAREHRLQATRDGASKGLSVTGPKGVTETIVSIDEGVRFVGRARYEELFVGSGRL